MAKLYIFGDSYSTPGFCVDPRDSWWGLLANRLMQQIEGIDNYSWPGNNIDSIAHIIVANQEMFQPDDYLVIGIPPIERLTVFDPTARHKQVVKFDPMLSEVDRALVPRHESLRQMTTHQLDRSQVDLWNRSWQEAQIMRQLLTLVAFIDKLKSRCIVVNLAEPFQPPTQWSVLENLQHQVANDPRMIIFENTYYSVNYQINEPVDFETHGWFGHQGPVGNRYWFDIAIEPLVRSLGWL